MSSGDLCNKCFFNKSLPMNGDINRLCDSCRQWYERGSTMGNETKTMVRSGQLWRHPDGFVAAVTECGENMFFVGHKHFTHCPGTTIQANWTLISDVPVDERELAKQHLARVSAAQREDARTNVVEVDTLTIRALQEDARAVRNQNAILADKLGETRELYALAKEARQEYLRQLLALEAFVGPTRMREFRRLQGSYFCFRYRDSARSPDHDP